MVYVQIFSILLSHLPNPDRIHFAECGSHSPFSAFARIHHNYSPTKSKRDGHEGRRKRLRLSFNLEKKVSTTN